MMQAEYKENSRWIRIEFSLQTIRMLAANKSRARERATLASQYNNY